MVKNNKIVTIGDQLVGVVVTNVTAVVLFYKDRALYTALSL